jgi:hypothetical protein
MRLDIKGTVYRGAGAREYLAGSHRDSAGDLSRLRPRRVVGRCAGWPLFHPSGVLYPAFLDADLSSLWRAAAHASPILRAESSVRGDIHDVGLPSGPGCDSRYRTSPARGRRCPGRRPHTLGHRPHLLLAGSVGVALYGSRLGGIVSALAIVVLSGAYFWAGEWFTIPAFSGTDIDRPVSSLSPGPRDIGLFFFKVGAITFGGGLTILAFMQDQVVNHLHWLTPQQFLDGLALGQLTPGPLLMLAAFVGYEVGAIWGAVAAAVAVYLPSFILILSVLPVLEHVKHLA